MGFDLKKFVKRVVKKPGNALLGGAIGGPVGAAIGGAETYKDAEIKEAKKEAALEQLQVNRANAKSAAERAAEQAKVDAVNAVAAGRENRASFLKRKRRNGSSLVSDAKDTNLAAYAFGGQKTLLGE